MADNGGIRGGNSGVEGNKAPIEAAFKDLRKVRIICTDPYATDSSSDEDDKKKREGPRRIVHEIVLPVKPVGGDEAVKKRKESSRRRTPGKKMTGVRMRKWGRWASEVRDPFAKKRLWLGTFDTAEEASKAYLAKKEEFRARAAEARSGTGAESDGDTSRKSSTGVSEEGDCPRNEKGKKLGLSRRSISGRGPTRFQCDGVRKMKSGRWSARVCDSSKRKRIYLGTYDSEEEASSAYQSKKLELESDCVKRPGPGSGSGSSLTTPKTDALSLLSDVASETVSGTTTASMEVSVSGDEGVKTGMPEGQVLAGVEAEANQPPWSGLGLSMLKIDNNGNLLGHFSRIDDDLKIC